MQKQSIIYKNLFFWNLKKILKNKIIIFLICMFLFISIVFNLLIILLESYFVGLVIPQILLQVYIIIGNIFLGFLSILIYSFIFNLQKSEGIMAIEIRNKINSFWIFFYRILIHQIIVNFLLLLNLFLFLLLTLNQTKFSSDLSQTLFINGITIFFLSNLIISSLIYLIFSFSSLIVGNVFSTFIIFLISILPLASSLSNSNNQSNSLYSISKQIKKFEFKINMGYEAFTIFNEDPTYKNLSKKEFLESINSHLINEKIDSLSFNKIGSRYVQSINSNYEISLEEELISKIFFSGLYDLKINIEGATLFDDTVFKKILDEINIFWIYDFNFSCDINYFNVDISHEKNICKLPKYYKNQVLSSNMSIVSKKLLLKYLDNYEKLSLILFDAFSLPKGTKARLIDNFIPYIYYAGFSGPFILENKELLDLNKDIIKKYNENPILGVVNLILTYAFIYSIDINLKEISSIEDKYSTIDNKENPLDYYYYRKKTFKNKVFLNPFQNYACQLNGCWKEINQYYFAKPYNFEAYYLTQYNINNIDYSEDNKPFENFKLEKNQNYNPVVNVIIFIIFYILTIFICTLIFIKKLYK